MDGSGNALKDEGIAMRQTWMSRLVSRLLRRDARLITAARAAALDRMQASGERADIHTKNAGGLTALWLAAQKGRADVVKLLIEKGGDVDAGDARTSRPVAGGPMGHAPL